jgi:hypothetical protein
MRILFKVFDTGDGYAIFYPASVVAKKANLFLNVALR